MPENAPALDLSTLPDQPRGLTLDLSKLPDQPAPLKPPTLDLSVLPDLPPQLRPPGEAHNWGLPQATIGVPRESDDEIYKSLKDNATNDEQVLEDYYGKVVIDAMKRLYSPDTASPKALAAAQNAIAISQATGMSPTLVIENRDAVNQALFGTGEARENSDGHDRNGRFRVRSGRGIRVGRNPWADQLCKGCRHRRRSLEIGTRGGRR